VIAVHLILQVVKPLSYVVARSRWPLHSNDSVPCSLSLLMSRLNVDDNTQTANDRL